MRESRNFSGQLRPLTISQGMRSRPFTRRCRLRLFSLSSSTDRSTLLNRAGLRSAPDSPCNTSSQFEPIDAAPPRDAAVCLCGWSMQVVHVIRLSGLSLTFANQLMKPTRLMPNRFAALLGRRSEVATERGIGR
jgi:hypothetical protein